MLALPFTLAPILEGIHGVAVVVLFHLPLVRQDPLGVLGRSLLPVVLQAGHALLGLVLVALVEGEGLPVFHRLKRTRRRLRQSGSLSPSLLARSCHQIEGVLGGIRIFAVGIVPAGLLLALAAPLGPGGRLGDRLLGLRCPGFASGGHVVDLGLLLHYTILVHYVVQITLNSLLDLENEWKKYRDL